jgi:hypothetical protein
MLGSAGPTGDRLLEGGENGKNNIREDLAYPRLSFLLVGSRDCLKYRYYKLLAKSLLGGLPLNGACASISPDPAHPTVICTRYSCVFGSSILSCTTFLLAGQLPPDPILTGSIHVFSRQTSDHGMGACILYR